MPGGDGGNGGGERMRVLMVEYTERVGRGRRDGFSFGRKGGVGLGVGIQKKGSDARVGEVVLEPGCRLWGQQLGICAAAGVMGGTAVGVPVRRVRVAVLTTGDGVGGGGGVGCGGGAGGGADLEFESSGCCWGWCGKRRAGGWGRG